MKCNVLLTDSLSVVIFITWSSSRQIRLKKPTNPGGVSSRQLNLPVPSMQDAKDTGSSLMEFMETSSVTGSETKQSVVSEMSDFQGGRRMEGLLQALNNEKKSGEFIRRFLKEAGNEVSILEFCFHSACNKWYKRACWLEGWMFKG